MNNLAYQGKKDRIPAVIVKLVVDNARAAGFTPKMSLDTQQALGPRAPAGALNGAYFSRSQFAPVYKACMAAIIAHTYEKDGVRSLTFDDFELMCSCIINCQRLEDALHKSVKFISAINHPYVRVALDSEGESARIRIEFNREKKTINSLICDFFAISFYCKFFSWMIAEPLYAMNVKLDFDAFVDKKILEGIMECPIEFSSSGCCIEFSKDMLRRPIVKTHRQLEEVLAVSPFELVPLPPMPRLSNILESILKKSLTEEIDIPTTDRIASLLGRSSPTIRRRLAQENTSFQVILDKCRMERSIELLKKSEMTIDEISMNLGFSAPSGFSRAFKGWTGCAPSIYRQNLRNA